MIRLGNISVSNMVLALQLYDVYRDPSWGLPVKSVCRRMHRMCVPISRVNVMFCVAGFCPGWPCIPAACGSRCIESTSLWPAAQLRTLLAGQLPSHAWNH